MSAAETMNTTHREKLPLLRIEATIRDKERDKDQRFDFEQWEGDMANRALMKMLLDGSFHYQGLNPTHAEEYASLGEYPNYQKRFGDKAQAVDVIYGTTDACGEDEQVKTLSPQEAIRLGRPTEIEIEYKEVIRNAR
jgi:hypothetical protein